MVYLRDIERSGHKEFLDLFVRFCILNEDPKFGAVWLWGVTNSGKTTVLNML